MEISTSLRGGGTVQGNLFHNIISLSNLFGAWKEFKKGKRKKADVARFELNLEDNIFQLYEDLTSRHYHHRPYSAFYVYDPKRRHIHKASVYDRIVHQAIYRLLYPIFDKHFIHDSYSSRDLHGTHLGVERSFVACRKVSRNWKRKIHVLKCDVRKFFDSIDHFILRSLIEKKVSCHETMQLIDLLFRSFEKEKGKGLPLGNVTSQLFANIYLNELDQFVKHTLKIKYYFRYCDDFIIVSEDSESLSGLIERIREFLYENLRLELHPNKVEVRSVKKGIDFLGYVMLPHMIVLRTHTKKRVLKNISLISKKLKSGIISPTKFQGILISYLGMVSHCRSRKLEYHIKNKQ